MRKSAYVVLGLLEASLLVALAISNAAADGSGPPQIPWILVPDTNQAPQGQELGFSVQGPQNSSFIVAVTEPPWNWSVPVFQISGNTSFDANNTSAPGEAVVRMPTAPFAQQEYQASLTVQGALVSQAYFFIVPSYNATTLETQLQELQIELALDESELSGARASISEQKSLNEWLEGTVVGATLLLCCIVLYAKYAGRVNSRLHRLYRAIHDFHWDASPPGFTAVSDGPTPRYVEQIIPEALYRAGYCPDCRKRQSELKVRLHLITKHPDVFGPSGPLLGTHYFLDSEAARAARSASATVDRKGAKRVRADERVRQVTPLSEMFRNA